MQDAPRILIVKTGTTYPETRRRFGDYDRWFVDALRGARAAFRVHDITRQGVPRLDGCDGVIITGSPAGVYERLSWMPELERLLRRLADRQDLPALGVCFGAQALAAGLGGHVAVNPRGWEIGTVRVRRTAAAREDPLLGGSRDGCFQATHQDWIERLPGGALVLAENEACPVQAFRVGERVWGTQFHPEATAAVLEDLIRRRRAALEGGRGGYRGRLASLRPTPEGRQLLRRFVGIVRL
ncbi:MAG: gamma-glutamyl-gamma-aminobutyrate hydrolase family protein [Acidobacteriota bacterium]